MSTRNPVVNDIQTALVNWQRPGLRASPGMDCNISVDAARAVLEAAGFHITRSSLQHKPTKKDDEVFTLYCVVAAGLVLIAGLMSGLTLGLMSLDALDLEVLQVPVLCLPGSAIPCCTVDI